MEMEVRGGPGEGGGLLSGDCCALNCYRHVVYMASGIAFVKSVKKYASS